MSCPTRILIVDDHAEVRQALKCRLSFASDLTVVGDVAEADVAIGLVRRLRPEVVLVETKRADGRGLELINWIAESGLGAIVIVLTSYPSEWERWAAHRAGALNYLLKDIDSALLIERIRQAALLVPAHGLPASLIP
ncbi:MAG: response regulator transcription factor [Anaerolineales bacterium]|nr:response regulator transcription factor [Anaerolineales bacterium]